MWEIDDSEASEQVTERLENEWNILVDEYHRKAASEPNLRKKTTAIYKTNSRNNENEEELILDVI